MTCIAAKCRSPSALMRGLPLGTNPARPKVGGGRGGATVPAAEPVRVSAPAAGVAPDPERQRHGRHGGDTAGRERARSHGPDHGGPPWQSRMQRGQLRVH